MTVPGVNDTSPAIHLLLLYIMTCMPCAPLSEKSRAVFDTHILCHGMPGWVVERLDYAELRAHVSTVYPLTTRPCSVQPSSKPLLWWQNNTTRYNMSYEGCDVMLRCCLDVGVFLVGTIVTQKKSGNFFFVGGGEGGS